MCLYWELVWPLCLFTVSKTLLLNNTGTPRSCNHILFSFDYIPQTVIIINMFSLQVYISEHVLCWVFWWLLCVCVCVCACCDLFFVCLCVSTAGLDIGPLADSSPVAPQSQAGRRTPRTLPEEPLDGILSPELDKMVTDGQFGRPDIQTLSALVSNTMNNDMFSPVSCFRINS